MPDVTRIIEQTATESIYNDDWLIKDSVNQGTTKIQPSVLKAWINEGMATDEELETAVDDTIAKLSAVGSSSGAIATFDDGSDSPMLKLEVAIEPQQDLHGYDSPWVGGSGKNKLPMTVDGIKAVNTYHSWSGNSTIINNVTITIETDSVGNVTGIRFNGTASADITFNLATNISISNGEYKWSNDQKVNISNLWLSLTSPNVAITLSSGKEKNVTVSNSSISSAYIYASSGNSFNNVVFKPMIRLASVTDATFAPYENICPISGWDEVNVTRCGKNLFDKSTVVLNKRLGPDGNEFNDVGYFYSAPIKVKSGDFYKNSPSQNAYHRVCIYDNNQAFVRATDSNAITISSGEVYVRFSGAITELDTTQFEEGNQATAYEPYNGQTYNIQFKDGDNPLIVYGGTLDVASGELTVNKVSVDLGTLYWSYSTADVRFFTANITDIKKVMDPSIVMNGLCSHYDIVAYQYVHKSTALDGVMGLYSTSTTNYLAIKDTRYTDTTSFTTAMNGVQLVYELATPLTIQLTPTQVNSLLGVNNIWADTGDVLAAEYIRDATTIINFLIARIEALENQ